MKETSQLLRFAGLFHVINFMTEKMVQRELIRREGTYPEGPDGDKDRANALAELENEMQMGDISKSSMESGAGAHQFGGRARRAANHPFGFG